MKKKICTLSLLAAVVISGFAFTTINQDPAAVSTTQQVETVTCKHGQCHATAKSTGKRCKHCVSNAGDRYCWQH